MNGARENNIEEAVAPEGLIVTTNSFHSERCLQVYNLAKAAGIIPPAAPGGI